MAIPEEDSVYSPRYKQVITGISGPFKRSSEFRISYFDGFVFIYLKVVVIDKFPKDRLEEEDASCKEVPSSYH